MTTQTVDIVSHVQRHRRSEGLSVAQLHQEHLPRHRDPFLAFDPFEMAQPFFPPHPHAGFSAVTSMLPESANGFVNRDSRGATVDILPGDLHRTAAGSGILHEETPMRRGVACHGPGECRVGPDAAPTVLRQRDAAGSSRAGDACCSRPPILARTS